MFQRNAKVVQNILIAEKTWLLELECPEIAQKIFPGQFVMLRVKETFDPLLNRAFALYDVCHSPTHHYFGIQIVYVRIGKMTNLLSEIQPGESLDIIGPLGKPFLDSEEYSKNNKLISSDKRYSEIATFIAGGIGQTPFRSWWRFLLGEESYNGKSISKPIEKIYFFWGARAVSFFGRLEDFSSTKIEIFLATEDGSKGFRGRVTDHFFNLFHPQIHPEKSPGLIYACGPEPMLEGLGKWCVSHNLICFLSLESPMACGYGVCNTCVVKIGNPSLWDYQKICVDGPAFLANDIVWDNQSN